MDTTTTQDLITIEQACAAVRVSRRTIYNWIHAGKVLYVRTAGGSVRIYRESLWRDANQRRDLQLSDLPVQ